MTSKIISIITDELLIPKLEMTRQYLKVLKVKYENDIPKISKVEFNYDENRATTYVELINDSFYLEFIVDMTDELAICSVDTSAFISVGYMAVSEKLTLDELLDLTTVAPQETIKKGDHFFREEEHTYNGLKFESYPGPGRIGSKLNFLLHVLEADIKGIKELSAQTHCKDIFITIVYHIGNENFTGLCLKNQQLKRLSELGLELTFDIYATGNKFLPE